MMKWKVYESKRSWAILKHHPDILRETSFSFLNTTTWFIPKASERNRATDY